MLQYGWSTPVHWRHDGVDEILVLGGDFKPNQRLMAYNLADGSERWWIGGLPPCGKSTPVIGDGLVYFAAPDIMLDPPFEQRNPDRAAQIYANNASRVTAVRPGGKGEANQTHIAWSETKGVPGVPSPLYYEGRLYTFLSGGIVYSRACQDRRAAVQRTARGDGLLLRLAGGRRSVRFSSPPRRVSWLFSRPATS